MDGGDPDWVTVSDPLPKVAAAVRESPALILPPQAERVCGHLLEMTLVCQHVHWKERVGGSEGNT